MGTSIAMILSLLALAALACLAVLIGDGLRTLLARRRQEAAARPLHLVVTARATQAGQLVRLTLARAGGGRLPSFRAGQHVMLQLPVGSDGSPAKRAYSLAAWSAAPRTYELGIKREAKGLVSGWVWDHLQVGTPVSASPPKGDFLLDEKSSRPLVLISGGIGITPMRAMLHAALAAAPRRSIFLFHAARSAGELLYRKEFETLAARTPAFHYHPNASRPDPAWPQPCRRLDAADIVAALAAAGLPVTKANYYLCAGRSMTETLRGDLAISGIDPAHIRWEAFSIAAGAGERGQRLRIVSGGTATEIVTAGEPTLLATLEAHRLAPPSACRAGTCGECRMRLLAGDVRWLTKPALQLAQDEFLPCICAAAGDLSATPS